MPSRHDAIAPRYTNFCKVPARFFNRQVNEENAELLARADCHPSPFASIRSLSAIALFMILSIVVFGDGGCIRGFVSISPLFAVENPSVNR
jgi:hypothetical protein